MILAFIIAVCVAIFFAILWSEEKEKREQAEMKIKQLVRENKKLKTNGRPAIVEKSKKTKGFAIPKPEKKEEPLLDKVKLATLQEQTKAAQAMLADIFIPEEEHVQDIVSQPDLNPIIGILGKLLTKEQWTRTELEELVGTDVMLGNLLEQINDFAYSKINDIVVEEDGDNIYVTTEYKEQLI
ncbi:MAG: hypothetical protein J6R30_04710 [Bacteroidales bacterium]|nr:hypothetical protein [Bacteroidales bacterium]